MITYIPPREIRRWTGPYLGNYYGTLWKTYNVDLDKSEGKVSLSRRMQRIEDSNDQIAHLSGTNRVHAFLRSNADCTDRYWALTDTGLLNTDSATPEFNTLPSDSWDTDGVTSSPTDPLDFTVHGNDSRNDSGRNKLFVTRDTGIDVLNDTGNNAWTVNWWGTKHSQPTLDSNSRHPIEYFPFRKITLVGDGNLIHTISRPSDTQNDTLSYGRLVLPKNLRIRHIFTTTNKAWILCDHRFKENGQIVEWDGSNASYNDIHNAYSVSALSGINNKETPIVLNSKGQFLEYTGRGFAPMIRNGQKIAFPSFEESGNHLLEDSSVTTGGSITGRVDPRGMTVGEDGNIYINRRGPQTSSFRDAGGIWCLNPETGRLYNKYSLGQWGDSTDYGVQEVYGAGAIYSVPSSTNQRDLLAGGTIFNTATATQGGIWLVEEPGDTAPTKGYFITQYIPSSEIKETWQNLWVKYERYINAADRIIVKAKGTRSLILSGGAPLTATITWTSTTTFTLTLASADDALQVGDEVEILNGANSGWLSHITTISGAHAALQTITIDETVTTASGTATALIDRWKKCKTITAGTVMEDMANVGIDSSFIQFKVELRGLERELKIPELIVVHEPAIKIEN